MCPFADSLRRTKNDQNSKSLRSPLVLSICSEMSTHDHYATSRPRSVATGVSRRSSMSRNSQLIKKNTGERFLPLPPRGSAED